MRGRFEGASVPFKCPALPLRLSEPPRRMVAPGKPAAWDPAGSRGPGPPSAMGSCEAPPPAAPSRCRSRPALGAGAGAALPRQRRRAPLNAPPRSWPPPPAPGHRRRPAMRSTSAATKKRRHGPATVAALAGHGAAVTRAAEPAAHWQPDGGSRSSAGRGMALKIGFRKCDGATGAHLH